MRAFFELIKTKIETDLTDYKVVKLFNSQDQSLKDLKEEVLTFPAVFVDFEFIETQQLALGIKKMNMVVRFRFMFENYTYDSRLDDLDKMTAFTAAFDLWTGKESDTLQFTPFHEILRGLDKDHDQINFPFIDYSTEYLNQENFTRSGQTTVVPVTPDITTEILE